MNKVKKYVIFVIPALYLLWSLQLNLLGGPFSLTRSDPEYPYLLNGLNCATLHFSDIGHTDHPGTPFQILTGVFIRLTHWAIGQGPVMQDVLARPETYLAMASFLLSLITFFLLLWIGRITMRYYGKLNGAVILQSSVLLSAVLIDIPLRYNPDRILILYNLILAGWTIRYLFSENYPARTYAILTGILMGIGFATKFNYLPVLIIPFLLIPDIKNRLIYGSTVIVAFFVSILPILSKFKDFRNFISGVVSHDGLYGSGTKQVINWKSFGHNFLDLLTYNPAYTIILILSVGMIIFFIVNKKKTQPDRRFLIIIKGFLYASIIGFILVSKHFKVYYFAPVLSFSGMAFFVLLILSEEIISKDRMRFIAGTSMLVFMILVSVLPLPRQYRSRLAQKRAVMKTQEFYLKNLSREDYLFIEPTWLAGPFTENALVYGISYVANRQKYYSEYHRLYPNVMTWEGAGKNPGLFRTVEADPESILFSGHNIWVYSSAGRNAGLLLNYLDTIAGHFGTRLIHDTVFVNPGNDDRVIRVANIDGWKTLTDKKLINDPLNLTNSGPVSEATRITGVTAGDYLEVTLRILSNDKDNRVRIIARSQQSEKDRIYFEDSGSLQDTGAGTQLLRLRGKIGATPADGVLLCQVYYPGSKKTTVQDLQIRHMGRR